MTERAWSYPVLWVDASGEFRVFERDSEMHLGDKGSAKKQRQLDAQFIDSGMRHWRVSGARFVDYRPRFSEWPRYLFARPGSIAFDTEFLGERQIGEVIQLLRITLGKDREIGEPERASIAAEILTAENYEQLIGMLRDRLRTTDNR